MKKFKDDGLIFLLKGPIDNFGGWDDPIHQAKLSIIVKETLMLIGLRSVKAWFDGLKAIPCPLKGKQNMLWSLINHNQVL
jgi:hypothetical protein